MKLQPNATTEQVKNLSVSHGEHKTISSVRGTTHYWITRCAHQGAFDSSPVLGARTHGSPGNLDAQDAFDASNALGAHGAPTLVFTHGLCANHSMFEKQVEAFASSYSVITWDVPLHGLSRPYTEFTYNNAADELAHILDAEHISEVVLVGMSMGGYPSQAFIDRYPQRVSAFIGIDTTPFGTSYYSKSDLWWLKRAGALMRLLPQNTLRNSIASGNSLTPYSHQLMLKMLASSTKKEICEQVDIAYKSFTEENRSIQIECPLLLIVGEKDTTGKVKQYCEQWARAAGVPLEVIPHAAHMSNTDNPEKVNEVIRRFLKELGCKRHCR